MTKEQSTVMGITRGDRGAWRRPLSTPRPSRVASVSLGDGGVESKAHLRDARDPGFFGTMRENDRNAEVMLGMAILHAEYGVRRWSEACTLLFPSATTTRI